jgi:uncharacterized protein YlxW (UPF0749 family)
MGLLDYIAASSLDQDYARVAGERAAVAARSSDAPRGDGPGRNGPGRDGPGRDGPARPGRFALAVLAVFGILVATAAVQTSRDADQTTLSRDALVNQANARRAQLARRVTQVNLLQAENSALEATLLDDTTQGRSLEQQLSLLGVLSGSQATRGPGIVVRVDDAPGATTMEQQVQARDLQKLVNGLWQAGAEAIAINGHRLTALSAIRDAAGAITVNFKSLERPYLVSAIGDTKVLGPRFVDTAGGQVWTALQSLGLQFDIENKDVMVLPAAKSLALRHAQVRQGRR